MPCASLKPSDMAGAPCWTSGVAVNFSPLVVVHHSHQSILVEVMSWEQYSSDVRPIMPPIQVVQLDSNDMNPAVLQPARKSFLGSKLLARCPTLSFFQDPQATKLMNRMIFSAYFVGLHLSLLRWPSPPLWSFTTTNCVSAAAHCVYAAGIAAAAITSTDSCCCI
jgi:hypothetical protein